MKTILCYGDSNTFGQIAGDTFRRFPRDVRWTGRLQSLLGSDYHVIEEGLGGRTTVWDDPVEEHKNGKTYLLPCLHSHKPLDLVILMLGTNDLKTRFSVSSFDIGESAANLVRAILTSGTGPDCGPPQVLLVTPTPIRDVGNQDFNEMLRGGVKKSNELAPYYQKVAELHRIHYLEPGDAIALSDVDGVHYTQEGHATMADLMAEKVRDIFR